MRRFKVTRSNEYKSLRHVVPSLRCQRDVGEVEVVTEAARYIDHLHKTLIERFVLCGIPDSLKDVLGTNDASELGSQHIMNLVTQMAATQRQQEQLRLRVRQRRRQRLAAASAAAPINFSALAAAKAAKAGAANTKRRRPRRLTTPSAVSGGAANSQLKFARTGAKRTLPQNNTGSCCASRQTIQNNCFTKSTPLLPPPAYLSGDASLVQRQREDHVRGNRLPGGQWPLAASQLASATTNTPPRTSPPTTTTTPIAPVRPTNVATTTTLRQHTNHQLYLDNCEKLTLHSRSASPILDLDCEIPIERNL